MLVKLIKKGAEADIYTGMWNNSKSVFKIRKIKTYRNSLLDSKIRKQRTIKESQVLSQVKSFGIPSPLVYFVNLEKSMIVMQDIPGKSVHDLSNSKIIEVSKEIGELVVKAAQAVDYTNLGTAEFLRADSGEFYFIEINARLQVEHPISEMVSGLDFVKLQLDIANGETLPFKQSDLKMNGYAIECRINAEDTFLDFAPSTGPVPYVTIPSGPSVRCDTYLYPGCTVSPFYDSLMAKLCTWGKTFDESRLRMLSALDDFDIQGVETSIPLYKTILNSDEYKTGNLSTDFLKRFEMIEKLEKDLIEDRKDKQIPAIASAIMHSEFYKSKVQSQNSRNQNWKNKMDSV